MRQPRPDDWVVPDRTPFDAVPIFGCQPYGAHTTCDAIHPGLTDPETGLRDGRLPSGTKCYCPVCDQTGREKHPGLQITSLDRLNLKRWQPEGGYDQWSAADTAEPTRYEGPTPPRAAKTRRQRRAEAFGHDAVATLPPDTLARQVDAGRARPL